MCPKNIIETIGLSKVYRNSYGTTEALREVNFAVPEGCFATIIGRSGSGKSTLMNILGCLDRPTVGEYYLAGSNVCGLSPAGLSEIRKNNIGFVFQGFHLIPRLTAEENVALPLLYRQVSREEMVFRARQALDRVGLSDRTRHRSGELSGGQQQRVAIARAIVTCPKLLLADEPTGNLDPESGQAVTDLLRRFNREGTTVVLITHDMKLARLADKVFKIRNGKISEAQ